MKGDCANADIADKGGWGVGEMLILADKGGRGVGEMLTMADKEGRGGLDPTFFADIICEQPLLKIVKEKNSLNNQSTAVSVLQFHLVKCVHLALFN